MFLTAFVIGLAGSLHCLGMCSPLIMAVTSFKKPYIYIRVLYNAGRITMYGVLGMAVSAFGSLFNMTGFQSILSISLGVILVTIGLTGTRLMGRIPFLSSTIQQITIVTKNLFSEILKEKKVLSYFLLGMLNGMLPCGLTYLALTYCLILPYYGSGFLFMLFFGLGTLPVMLGFTSIVKYLIEHYHLSLPRFSTISMIVLGALLIARGTLEHSMNQGNSTNAEIVICK